LRVTADDGSINEVHGQSAVNSDLSTRDTLIEENRRWHSRVVRIELLDLTSLLERERAEVQCISFTGRCVANA